MWGVECEELAKTQLFFGFFAFFVDSLSIIMVHIDDIVDCYASHRSKVLVRRNSRNLRLSVGRTQSDKKDGVVCPWLAHVELQYRELR